MGEQRSRVFAVEGMGCGKCAAKIEKRVGGMDGVRRASVDLARKTLVVEGSFRDELVVEAVADAGDYTATAAGDA